MAIVKLKDKSELDKLVATLTIVLGQKVTQQDVIAACIKIAASHLEELRQFLTPTQSLSKKRVKQILNMADDFTFETRGSIDEDLYGGAK